MSGNDQAVGDAPSSPLEAEEELPPQVWTMAPDGVIEWANGLGLTAEALHPEDAGTVTEEVRRSLASEQPFERRLRMRRPDGAFRWAQAQLWPIRGDDGRVERWIGLATDLEARARRLSLLGAVATPESPFGLLLVDRDLRYVRVSPASAAFLGLVPTEVEGRRLVDLDPELWEQVAPVHQQILHGAGPTTLEVSSLLGGVLRHRLLLYYPARVDGDLIGFGVVDIDITDRKRAELAAASLAEERRGLLRALVRAQERERRRVAADIHGDTLQVLAAVRLKLEALAATLGEPDQRAALTELDRTFGMATERLRGLLFELWPPSLERAGLNEAVSELLVRLERDGGATTHLEASVSDDLPLDVRGVIFRVVCEAITNVRQHAMATSVDVRIHERDGQLTVTVSDDGVGFDPSAPRFGHVGLREMDERVQAAGGTMTIRSGRDAGTTISITVPIGDGAIPTLPSVQ